MFLFYSPFSVWSLKKKKKKKMLNSSLIRSLPFWGFNSVLSFLWCFANYARPRTTLLFRRGSLSWKKGAPLVGHKWNDSLLLLHCFFTVSSLLLALCALSLRLRFWVFLIWCITLTCSFMFFVCVVSGPKFYIFATSLLLLLLASSLFGTFYRVLLTWMCAMLTQIHSLLLTSLTQDTIL